MRRADELNQKADANMAAAAQAKARDNKRANDAKRKEEIKRADELKWSAEADLAAAADAKAKAETEAAKQSLERERRFSAMRASDEVAPAAAAQEVLNRCVQKWKVCTRKKGSRLHFFGATETKTREGREDGQSESEAKRKTIDKTAESAKNLLKKTRATCRFEVSDYDVVATKVSKNDLNMPQLLIAKKPAKGWSASKRWRSSGDQNYQLFLTCIRHILHSRSCPNCFFHHGKLEHCWIKQCHPTVSPRVTYTLPYCKTQSFHLFKVMQKT